MKQIEPLERAQVVLQDFAVKQNSIARKLCYFLFDILLISGFAYYAILTYMDRDYWKKAPNYFNYFLPLQYAILALCIRLPVMSSISSSSATKLTALLILLLIVNTTTGIIWLRELTEPVDDDVAPSTATFNLKDKYIAHGVVLILVPLSVFLFLFIVLIKVLCFFIADPKHRRGRGESRSYG